MAEARTRLFHPPRMRAGEPSRHATWLELFFDLVFVVAITEAAHFLHKPLSFANLGMYLLLYLPIYWAWVGHTEYANRFDTDDLPFRLITFGMMVAALMMAVPIDHLATGTSWLFVAGYLVARGLLLALYLRAHAHLPEARPMTRLYVRGYSLGALVWLASLGLPAPLQYVLWAIGLGVDMVMPWWGRATLARFPLHTEHFPERLGLLTIIVMGESIIATEAGLSAVPPEGAWLLTAVLGFLVMACIWWLYFTFVQHAKLDRSLGHGLPYVYVHLPLTIGIGMLAVGIGHLVKEAAKAEPLDGTLVLIGLGSTLWLASFFAMMWRADRRHLHRHLIAAFAAATAGTAALCWFGAGLRPPVLLGTFLAIYVALVVADLQYGLPAQEITDERGATGGPPSGADEGRA